jgi:hypothetical protein
LGRIRGRCLNPQRTLHAELAVDASVVMLFATLFNVRWPTLRHFLRSRLGDGSPKKGNDTGCDPLAPLVVTRLVRAIAADTKKTGWSAFLAS